MFLESLCSLRKKAGFKSAKEAACFLGVEYRTYLSWESGRRKVPKVVVNFLNLYVAHVGMKEKLKEYIDKL